MSADGTQGAAVSGEWCWITPRGAKRLERSSAGRTWSCWQTPSWTWASDAPLRQRRPTASGVRSKACCQLFQSAARRDRSPEFTQPRWDTSGAGLCRNKKVTDVLDQECSKGPLSWSQDWNLSIWKNWDGTVQSGKRKLRRILLVCRNNDERQ